MSIEQDRAFVAALLDGDSASWDELARCVESWCYNASRRHYIVKEEIKDIKQDILEKLAEKNCQRLQQFSFRCRLSIWIGCIVNNHLFDNYAMSIRREKRNRGFEELKRDIHEQEGEINHLIEKIDNRNIIEEALDQLKPNERSVIQMIYWEGLMPKDAARITGERVSTITSRLSRARNKLKEILMESNPGKGDKVI